MRGRAPDSCTLGHGRPQRHGQHHHQAAGIGRSGRLQRSSVPRPTSQLASQSAHCHMENALTRNCRPKSSSRRNRTFIRSGISNRSFAPTVALLQPQSPHTMPITSSEVIGMFDVYVRGKNQLLVIRRGAPLPAGIVGSWRKKRAARAVSDEISGAVLRKGFYTRLKTPGSILPQTCEQVRMPAKNY